MLHVLLGDAARRRCLRVPARVAQPERYGIEVDGATDVGHHRNFGMPGPARIVGWDGYADGGQVAARLSAEHVGMTLDPAAHLHAAERR
ncbi:MAG: hypothetical protein ACLPSH_18245 [Vulcanimicrobiaceae bacterium]